MWRSENSCVETRATYAIDKQLMESMKGRCESVEIGEKKGSRKFRYIRYPETNPLARYESLTILCFDYIELRKGERKYLI